MQSLIDLSSRTIVVKRNEILKSANTIDTNVYYIHDGAVQIYIRDEHMDQIIRFGYKQSIITALDSYFTERPSALIIQAIKKSSISIIPKVAIEAYFQQAEQHQVWKQILEDLVLQQFNREIDLHITAPRERYLRVLERSPQLFQEIPHKYIANYLSMSPETLSRLKKS